MAIRGYAVTFRDDHNSQGMAKIMSTRYENYNLGTLVLR